MDHKQGDWTVIYVKKSKLLYACDMAGSQALLFTKTALHILPFPHTQSGVADAGGDLLTDGAYVLGNSLSSGLGKLAHSEHSPIQKFTSPIKDSLIPHEKVDPRVIMKPQRAIQDPDIIHIWPFQAIIRLLQ